MDIKTKNDEMLEDFIKLRKARANGKERYISVVWLRDFLFNVNSFLGDINVRFTNLEFHEWKYLSMETVLPGKPGKRHLLRLTAWFDGDSPEYHLAKLNEKGKPYKECIFFRLADPEIGLIASLHALYPEGFHFIEGGKDVIC